MEFQSVFRKAYYEEMKIVVTRVLTWKNILSLIIYDDDIYQIIKLLLEKCLDNLFILERFAAQLVLEKESWKTFKNKKSRQWQKSSLW